MMFVVWFNVHIMRTASSTNFAYAYAAGLMASWGTIMSMNLLVWKRPQFEAARVIKIKVNGEKMGVGQNGNTGSANGVNGKTGENGLRLRKVNAAEIAQECGKDIGKDEDRYIWQMFPEKGTFWERLGWAVDLSCSFRGAGKIYNNILTLREEKLTYITGWNYSITSIPRPPIPSSIIPSSPVTISAIPPTSTCGYTIPLTETALLTSRLLRIIPCYFLLDFLSVQMMKDPFFILGPDTPHSLPAHLQTTSPFLILFYRECLSLVGVWAAINAVFNINDLAQYYFFKTFFPSRAALWHYASTFGSVSEILDRGLAGWWGAWWHQTFRLEFLGPSVYLLRKGYIKRGTQIADAVGLFASFFQSGLMHAAGSLSSIPATKPWRSMVFFLLQGVGIALQQRMALYLRKYTGGMPRILRQVGNVVFCLVWLYVTAPFFVNDLASTGLWMFEPVPISPLRYMGFGHPDDHWWRWDRDHFPKLYSVKNWWEVGIAL